MKRKSKKRRKLLLLPVFFSFLLLSTTSYAWFSANRVVLIESMNVHVQTDGGIEVSTNAIDWKQVVTIQDIMDARQKYANSVNQLPYTLNPVSTAGTIENGKLNMYSGVTTNSDSTDFYLTATKSEETESYGEDSEGDFIAFDLFFRVKSTKELYLSSTSSAEYTGTATSGIENAVRIAFLKEGVSEDTPSISQNLKGATTMILWEPNYDTHTQYGVSHAYNVYGLTTSQTGASRLPYYGVDSEIKTSDQVLVQDANPTKYPSFFKNMNVDISTPQNNLINQKIMDIDPAVTKVRVYIWIEGQDVDCEDNASYGDITFNIELTTNPA